MMKLPGQNIFVITLLLAVTALLFRFIYEKRHPVVLSGNNARFVAVASTGADINSPVAYLFGRAPYFLVCDRSNLTYKIIANKFMDQPHAVGLRVSEMLVKKNIDAVCGNNFGFEPARIFKSSNVEMYTDIKGTVLQTIQSFPEAMVKVDKMTVPQHYGITGSKKLISCSSFDAQANVAEIVQGTFSICYNCGYKIASSKIPPGSGMTCPHCSNSLHQVVSVAVPVNVQTITSGMKVF
ncbi:MAG: NifB/NifX family molybdenum-iron cluster-binding protein [Fibrobacteria bacterium]|nr:NifB/NifX family molybdenum-iron cluster-binding protein [Fibrobacteria bacterium]